jgi:hypothetical protein
VLPAQQELPGWPHGEQLAVDEVPLQTSPVIRQTGLVLVLVLVLVPLTVTGAGLQQFKPAAVPQVEQMPPLPVHLVPAAVQP